MMKRRLRLAVSPGRFTCATPRGDKVVPNGTDRQDDGETGGSTTKKKKKKKKARRLFHATFVYFT